jgi:hypothetical protein
MTVLDPRKAPKFTKHTHAHDGHADVYHSDDDHEGGRRRPTTTATTTTKAATTTTTTAMTAATATAMVAATKDGRWQTPLPMDSTAPRPAIDKRGH